MLGFSAWKMPNLSIDVVGNVIFFANFAVGECFAPLKWGRVMNRYHLNWYTTFYFSGFFSSFLQK